MYKMRNPKKKKKKLEMQAYPKNFVTITKGKQISG